MSNLHEECGVFGVYSNETRDVASTAYYGLFALQHRGQESCGIVVNDDGVFSSYKDIGLVDEVFTPSEAAAVAVAYSLIVGFFVYRNLKIGDLWELFMKMARTTGVVFLVIAAASILGWVLTIDRIPAKVAALMLSISTNKWVIMLLILILLLFIGMFMDIAAALIILGPILHPLAVSLGFHPLHFGIVMVLALNIALMTPPVGACLFVACGISKLTLEQLSREIFPFIIVVVIVLFIIAFVPDIPLFLPRLFGYA